LLHERGLADPAAARDPGQEPALAPKDVLNVLALARSAVKSPGCIVVLLLPTIKVKRFTLTAQRQF
jgi:hypothetical protein